MKEYRLKMSETIPTSTGNGHRDVTMVLRLTDSNNFISFTPIDPSYVEGAPDPGGESTL